jgi:hypothetical protein
VCPRLALVCIYSHPLFSTRLEEIARRLSYRLPDTLEGTKALLDDVVMSMNFLADYAVKVRTHYNALAPMDRVPDDVLRQILYLLSPSVAFDASKSNFIPKRALVSTHVCRRWRTLALNSPTFWSAPLFRWHPDAATTTLGRAKDTLLKVSPTLRKNHYSVINAMFRRLPTIKYLNLDGRASMLDHYLTHFSHPAPQLEVLKLACSDPRNQTVIRSNIFSGDVPRLRTVELTNCYSPRTACCSPTSHA